MTIWRIRIAYWIPKTTNTDSEYATLTAFPRQQWLRERASVLRYFTLPVLLQLRTIIGQIKQQYIHVYHLKNAVNHPTDHQFRTV